jgi:hypothetical protein
MKLFSTKTLLLASVLSTHLYANSIVADFLSATKNITLQENETLESIYQRNAFKSSYIDKARVSIEHSHFSDVERDYSLRLYTNNPIDIENQKKIFNIEKKLNLNEKNIDTLSTIRERYQLLSELIYKYSLITLLDAEIEFQQNALKKSAYYIENESDVMKVYKNKEKLQDMKLEKAKLHLQYNNLLSQIEQLLEDQKREDIENAINLSLLLSPYSVATFISENIDPNNSDILESHPILERNFDKVRLEEQKIKAIEDKNNIKLDYIGFKYDDSKKSKNAFSVDVAVEIPISHESQKIVNEKIKLLKSKERVLKNRAKIKNKISILQQEIKELLQYFHKVDAQLNETAPRKNGMYAYKLYDNMEKRNIKLKKERSKIAYQLIEKYISFLYWSNNLKNTNFYTLFQHNK